jgi:hypothetical protein
LVWCVTAHSGLEASHCGIIILGMKWEPPPIPDDLRLLLKGAIEKWGEQSCAELLHAAHVLDKPVGLLAEEFGGDPHAVIQAAKVIAAKD